MFKTDVDGDGDLMDASGKDLGEFLENLQNFHTRIAMFFQTQAAALEVSDRTANSLKLHYHTHRAGWHLCRGFVDRFGRAV